MNCPRCSFPLSDLGTCPNKDCGWRPERKRLRVESSLPIDDMLADFMADEQRASRTMAALADGVSPGTLAKQLADKMRPQSTVHKKHKFTKSEQDKWMNDPLLTMPNSTGGCEVRISKSWRPE